MESMEEDICRVCRSEGTSNKPLFHPCVCTGSIKFIHQECLLLWLKHSGKEYCELCKHRFAFTPIYSPDMPSLLPLHDIFAGLVTSTGTAIRYCFYYTLVAFAWLGVVPLTACRIYKCFFTGSLSALLTLPVDMLSTQNLQSDWLQGCFVATCTSCVFVSLLWLREQIVHGGGPQWLEQNPAPLVPNPPDDFAAAHEDPGANAAYNGQAAWNPAGPVGHPGDDAELDYEDDEDDDDDEWDEEDEEEEEGRDEDAADANNGGQDDLNWNGLEWDRIAEELTWMLGLDDTLIFLEHVFCVMALNTLFILLFAFVPYHIGCFSAFGLGFEDYIKDSHFEGLITIILGYFLLAGALLLSHALASLIKFQWSRHFLGVCYIVVKVSLLVVMEIGLFPLICGWWLDICTLEMFDATLKDREERFVSGPSSTMFLHWLIGMAYIFNFASFVLLLREVLRPGVLWFLRNLNGLDFSPVQEMIHLPMYRHIRRFLLSVMVFGSVVLLMLWLPIRIIKLLFPSFLPYNVMLYSDALVSELCLVPLLRPVVLPAVLEQGHTRKWLKGLVHAWTFTVGYVLDIHSYLLGEHENEENLPNNPANRHNDQILLLREELRAVHRGIPLQGGPVGSQPFYRPTNFPLKIALLVIFTCATLLLASLTCLTVPVCVGRWLMSFWMGTAVVHELYTAASGLYICWVSIRAATVLLSWMPQGRTVMVLKFHESTLMILKAIVVTLILSGLIPLLLGLLLELVIFAPLRVPLDQTPLFYPWQNWALGVLYTKIIVVVALVGPQWWIQTVLEQVYVNDIRNIDLCFIVRWLAAPVICVLLLSLCVPYTISKGITPLLRLPLEMQTLVERGVYPFLFMVVVLLAILPFQIQQFKELYEHIKNDKYLVGQRLVNYERKMSQTNATSS